MKRIVCDADLRIVRVLICFDICRAAYFVYYAIVDKCITVACAGACNFGVDFTVFDGTDRRAVLLFFSIIINACIAAAGGIRLLPEVGVVVPVLAVINSIAISVAVDG